uniref:Ent-copalyl diphosphate synthase n=1 Tax=Aconitum carmichaelii TaxID=85363 RepID=A0A8E8TY42_ACOCM|nr:ent-copalyl diphosphate synthase [Aconitum carmichaelii]
MASLSSSFNINSALAHLSRSPSSDLPLPWFASGIWSVGTRDKRPITGLLSSESSKHVTRAIKETTKQNVQQSKWMAFTEQDTENDQVVEVQDISKVAEWVEKIKSMLSCMEDGDISISAYDTAWVALVKDIDGNDGPHFPSSLQWIVDNQLSDGSWGDEDIYSAHDRILNTLGCIVALKTWNVHPEKCENGLAFIRQNINKLEDENIEHMPIGFEVAFPSTIEIARKIGLEIPVDSPAVQEIYEQRNLKLSKIPMDMVHMVPTTLLHSLEGMEGLDWGKLIKLQSSDGSMLFSPSSTAFALMNTKNEKCLEYLKKPVEKFNGGVPNVYPVDLFENVWAVDRLERLGISRYFRSEIKSCIDYVARYWTKNGIAWARNSNVCDIDDTAMGFRLLRLHGHDVSPDVFRHFEKGGEFFCFAGQSNQAVTGLFNLYRATQVLFPGDTILERAKSFAYKFLRQKQAANELLDKWIITKDLPGEVGYALDVPWYASLPRIETRFYLEQYGGKDDVWIGKTLYRMGNVNNDIYLDLAKLDYNNCQAVHQMEWKNIQKWYTKCNLGEFGVKSSTLLKSYFIAASSIFEPERSSERLSWTKTMMLVEAVSSHLKNSSDEQNKSFINNFINTKVTMRNSNGKWNTKETKLIHTLVGTLNNLTQDTERKNAPCEYFEKWLLNWQEENDKLSPTSAAESELLVHIISSSGGYPISGELLSHPQYKHLVNLTKKICVQLRNHHSTEVGYANVTATTLSIEADMQELVQIVLQKGSGIDEDIKQVFLIIVKSFFYTAICPQETMDRHISDVLFKRVD